MKKNKLPDWAIRALKTFVQSLVGVIITSIIALLSNGFPESLSAAWIVVSPVLAAGLASALSATWNICLEHMKRPEIETEKVEQDEEITE